MGNILSLLTFDYIQNANITTKSTNKPCINSNRIIIYYQTLNDLSELLEEVKQAPKERPILTHITLASIHFGYNDSSKTKPYIHLNDNNPTDRKFQKVYSQLREFKQEGIQINLLIGGAGSAFQSLFSNYSVYYKLLQGTVNYLNFIDGFNLDIEEEVSIANMVKLIKELKTDFPDKDIIFAPLGSSIASNSPGMGGFAYKDLIKALPASINIAYYNTQCYGEYSYDLFEEMLNNGYKSEEIVMGMLVGQDFQSILSTLEEIKKKYPDFGGVAVWEYFNAPKEWCTQVSNKLYPQSYTVSESKYEIETRL